MGLLPCIRRGGDRWWLPRTGLATDVLGHIMLAHARGVNDPSLRRRATGALRTDPALFIFAALNWSGESADVADLADWLVDQITGRFASGDALLGAPTITDDMQRRWKRLTDHYSVLPIERWLEDAPLWLEVSGPQVSSAWRQQWPEIHAPIGDSEPPPGDGNSCMLQQLARSVQRQRSLQRSFDRRVSITKLAAIKELAYGLSHEINNPLANISTRAQQLQNGEQDASRVATLQRIIDQVYRAHEMIADLMFYANPPRPQLTRFDLSPVLREVVATFSEETERQSIRVEVRLPNQPVTVDADGKMIGEAIRVLIRNAIDAIGCQGTIVVSIAANGNHWKIHIADSGPGLSESARRHAFDPYYSGREAGRGLGLGLCRAYRIARLHHADITLAGGPAGCVATIAIEKASL